MRIGSYRAVKLLGEGSFGKVYLVEKQGKLYALKKLVASGEEALVRFFMEIEGIEKLKRDYGIEGIVEILDQNPEEGYYVMEYLPEGSKEYYRRTKDIGFLEKLIETVAALHRAGVVHRDIKPQNVRSRDGSPVLLDFGAASWQESRTRFNFYPAGSRLYMPPEMMRFSGTWCDLETVNEAFLQLGRLPATDRAERVKKAKMLHDVYSLALTVGEIATGRNPFADEEVLDHYLRSGSLSPLKGWLEEIPPQLRGFVEKGLSFYPLERPLLVKSFWIAHEPFKQNSYFCLHCKKFFPPGETCPSCGALLRYALISLQPDQQIETTTLPEGVAFEKNRGQMRLKIELDCPDFALLIGRVSGHLVFPDDLWMSGRHGSLLKKGREFYYRDGWKGKRPTNPTLLNGLPAEDAMIKLNSGDLLIMGSTSVNFLFCFAREGGEDEVL